MKRRLLTTGRTTRGPRHSAPHQTDEALCHTGNRTLSLRSEKLGPDTGEEHPPWCSTYEGKPCDCDLAQLEVSAEGKQQ